MRTRPQQYHTLKAITPNTPSTSGASQPAGRAEPRDFLMEAIRILGRVPRRQYTLNSFQGNTEKSRFICHWQFPRHVNNAIKCMQLTTLSENWSLCNNLFTSLPANFRLFKSLNRSTIRGNRPTRKTVHHMPGATMEPGFICLQQFPQHVGLDTNRFSTQMYVELSRNQRRYAPWENLARASYDLSDIALGGG